MITEEEWERLKATVAHLKVAVSAISIFISFLIAFLIGASL